MQCNCKGPHRQVAQRYDRRRDAGHYESNGNERPSHAPNGDSKTNGNRNGAAALVEGCRFFSFCFFAFSFV